MLTFYLLFQMLFFLCFSGQTNFTAPPNQRYEIACSEVDTQFLFYVSSKDFQNDIMQTSYTFSVEQIELEMVANTNQTQNISMDKTFSVQIQYVFGSGHQSTVSYETNFEDANIMNFFIVAQSGDFIFKLQCSEIDNVMINRLAFTFFPSKVRIKPLEFNSGYQLVNVAGYFSGVYVQYDTFVIYAINLVNPQQANVEVTLNECIGDVEFFHLAPDMFMQYLASTNSTRTNNFNSGTVYNDNSNKRMITLFEGLNFLVLQSIDGVVFQYGMPSKAMARITTKVIEMQGMPLPILISTNIAYNYNFPEVLLNFSKITLGNESQNGTNITGNYSLNSGNNLNQSNQTNPIQYKIIIAQNYIFLSIVSKCGLDVFQSIPQTGNFQNINTYYKEIIAGYAQNIKDLLHNQTNQTNDTKNGNITNGNLNLNGTIIYDDNPQNSSENPGFLPNNNSNNSPSNNTNSTVSNDTNNFTNIQSLDLKPFTIYDNGKNGLNLVVNLDTRDYYFITALGYLATSNDTYFYYDPILIKDSNFGDNGLPDFGMILIIIGAVIFALAMLFCFFKCMRRYMNAAKNTKKDKSKKKNKFSDQQKILFGKPQENMSDKMKQQDRLSQILGPSDIKIAKIM